MTRINQQHVAKLLNISQATVSRAIHGGAVSEETRRIVFRACEQLGYKVHYTAQSLASGRTSNLVYAIEAFKDLSGEVTHNQLIGAGDRALAEGYKLSMGLIDDVPELAACGFMDGALVAIHTPAKHPEFMEWVRHTDFPVVLVDAPVEEPGIANVRIDHWQAGYELTRYVLSLGHKSVAFFGLVAGSKICTDRYQGFLSALQQEASAVGSMVEIEHWIGRPEDVLNLRYLVARLDPLPTAIIASSDACAMGLIDLLRTLGYSVPDDISVAGFGNSRWSGVMSPLSTIDLQGVAVGKAAMDTLLRLLDGGRRRATRKVPGILVARTSCAAPPVVVGADKHSAS